MQHQETTVDKSQLLLGLVIAMIETRSYQTLQNQATDASLHHQTTSDVLNFG